ncbi:MAG: CIA30 family protein [Candidatus Kapabacteria bacterium]|nr:CIA30 family protein [Ignavibacteriota bacterium]MCW5885976.1 CIA30 family protein [Candidatus Kapabacteria bacterium]
MIVLLIIMLMLINISSNEYLIDFGTEKSGSDWYIINDGVMGGLSLGNFKLAENSMVFSGNISLDNNGGFSALRSPFGKYDLSKFDYLEIKSRSKGQIIAFTLETDNRFFMPYYKFIVSSGTDEFVITKIKLSDFKAYRLARETGDYLSENELQKIIRMGFITSDKKASDFEFEVEYIKFY